MSSEVFLDLVFYVILPIGLLTIFILLLTLLTFNRAVKSGVYAYKYGMVVDKKGKIIQTKTAVYFDPKTGASFLGETIFIEDKK